MSLKFPRKKKRNYLLSLFYWLDKILPLSKRAKLSLYLDVEWAADRLAHERSFQVFTEHPVRKRSFEFLRRHLSSHHKVMDLGCGNGDLSRLIAGEVHQVIAVDHNPRMIDRANQTPKPDNLTFHTGDALQFVEALNQTFDVLILSHVVEHLEDPQSFLHRHRNGARFFYIEVPDQERTPLNAYREQLQSGLSYSDNDHIWEFNRDDMIQLIRSSGLTIQDSEYRFGVQKYWCEKSNPQDVPDNRDRTPLN